MKTKNYTLSESLVATVDKEVLKETRESVYQKLLELGLTETDAKNQAVEIVTPGYLHMMEVARQAGLAAGRRLDATILEIMKEGKDETK